MSRLKEKGQSLIETALALPVLLFLFMGLTQLIALGWAHVLCSHAAEAAVRVYTVRHADDEKQAVDMATDTASRILSRAWPQILFPSIEVESADPGECCLRLTAVVPPLWGWTWALQHFGFMVITRDAHIQDEATDACLREDSFRNP